jgi:AcrR family transcriptional regulator
MRADARRNYERLVAVARDAFTERGYEASLDDIARRAGVGPGTLYRHFPTREALLAAVYRGDVERLAEQAADLAKNHPPAEALAAWLRAQLDYIKFKGGLGAALKTMLANDSQTLDYCRDTLRGALADLLEAAQADGTVRADVDAGRGAAARARRGSGLRVLARDGRAPARVGARRPSSPSSIGEWNVRSAAHEPANWPMS